MKNYEEYLKDYQKAISEGRKKGGYVIRECVYISMKWQTDNNWNPWDNDAETRLEALRLFDIRLYQAVIEGIELVAKGMKQ